MDPNMIPIDAWLVDTQEALDNIIMRGGKVILMSEEIPPYLQGKDSLVVNANCILPDYEAVTYYIENDVYGFKQSYINFLCGPDCDPYITSIIAAIINGIPLAIIFGNEEIEIAACNTFCELMRSAYGICFGVPMNQQQYPAVMLRAYTPMVVEKLFMSNLLTAQEYLLLLPERTQVSPVALPKLSYEVLPVVKDINDPNSFMEYFDEIRKNMRAFSDKKLIDPLERA